MFESIQGGRDYGERPNFYGPFDGHKAYIAAKPLAEFLKKSSAKDAPYEALVREKKLLSLYEVFNKEDLRYLPIIARNDWIAILSPEGQIVEYLPGDGF